MIFDKEKYYNYILKLEKRIDYYYILIIAITTIIGAFTYKIKGIIIGLIIGILIGNYITLKIKIKIQEMRMKLDLYNKIKEST